MQSFRLFIVLNAHLNFDLLIEFHIRCQTMKVFGLDDFLKVAWLLSRIVFFHRFDTGDQRFIEFEWNIQ